MNKNNKTLFLKLHQIAIQRSVNEFVVKRSNDRIQGTSQTGNKETETKIFISPGAILAYKDNKVLLHTGWITVKETAEQICQQICSSEE